MLSCLRKVYFLGKIFNFLAEIESYGRKKRKIRQKESATLDDFTGPKLCHLYMYPKLYNELCKTRVLIGLEECVIRV